ncbi:sucrase ferredoxin [Microcoleus sp. FACHB-1515]|uniref:sucrase ferredoxin n=1 Tax=Cyanophyceae TaxID=3028117 RepID=UPI0016882B07|nr:sucrase ferredoxin [Microcoleus sp. FACHB-1515]MBD2091495.1 sucrase ferredoxin [Microcoleus sp. FACHB-1515]
MTTNPFFCAESSRESGVDIVGTASDHEIYIAIECPPPWEADEIESRSVPDNLRELIEEVDEEYDRFLTRFLFIYSELKQENCTRLLIFQKQSEPAIAFKKLEFELASIEEVAPLVKNYLMNGSIDKTSIENSSKDVLICTHGSRDRCCSRFGNPLYRQAVKIVNDRSLDVRIWQASHIGGHRMAPTAITFPDVRYYGYLDADSLTSILTRTGDFQSLQNLYRGCGILPWAVQFVERELMFQAGWKWFDWAIDGRVLEHNDDESFNQVELIVETPEGARQTYTATVVLDDSKIIYLKGSCSSESASRVEQYIVRNLTLVESIRFNASA